MISIEIRMNFNRDFVPKIKISVRSMVNLHIEGKAIKLLE